jgi:hypothetical protein
MDDDKRQQLKELYEARQRVDEQISVLWSEWDARREKALEPLRARWQRLDEAMLGLIVAENVTWIEGRLDDAGLPVLDPVQ